MTPLAAIIVEEICSCGPIPFSRFMELALYHPVHGYYCHPRLGRSGDFYTACQLQPVFGCFVRTLMQKWLPSAEVFIDLGAGREDMREQTAGLPYFAVHPGSEIPKTQNAFLFANEFFDALPVDIESNGVLLRVDFQAGEFCWYPFEPVTQVRERNTAAVAWLEKAYSALASPSVFVIIDYGYTAATAANFPLGSTLAYRQHTIVENVLANPGTQDITAHVDWDSLVTSAKSAGWKIESFSRLDQALFNLGEDFLSGVQRLSAAQTKSLLFDFGAGFDVLILSK